MSSSSMPSCIFGPYNAIEATTSASLVFVYPESKQGDAMSVARFSLSAFFTEIRADEELGDDVIPQCHFGALDHHFHKTFLRGTMA